MSFDAEWTSQEAWEAAWDQAEARIVELQSQVDWWRQKYLILAKPEAGEVSRLDMEATEFGAEPTGHTSR